MLKWKKLKGIGVKKYAVIVDEAHSSQGGEAAKSFRSTRSKNLEEAIELESEEETEDYEDQIRKSMMARGHHENLSFSPLLLHQTKDS